MTRRLQHWLAVACLVLASATPTFAQSFAGLGFAGGAATLSRARAVSADGQVVVGTVVLTSNSDQAFRWTRSEGIEFLDDLPGGSTLSQAYGVSPDARAILGYSSSSLGRESCTWTAPSYGAQGLGDLPGGMHSGRASACSSDASVIVGRSHTAAGWEAYRYTAGARMVGLGDLPGGRLDSIAHAVSADGSVVVGSGSSAQSGDLSEGFRWTAATGMVPLGDLPGGLHASQAYDVSGDGSVVVGFSSSARAFNGEAVRWVNGVPFPLANDPGPDTSWAMGVTPDGAVIVGRQSFSEDLIEAFLWDEASGLRNLRLVLTGLGLDLTGWKLDEATAVSADGMTIVGEGTNPEGRTEAWVAVLPEPALPSAAAMLVVMYTMRPPRGR